MMGLFDRAAPFEALRDLFERERSAILAGRFDVLDRLSTEKERLFSAVARADRNTAALSGLRRLADRNHILLGAMQNGIQSAARRIEAIRKGPGALHTYDATGERQTIAATVRAVQRKV